MTHPTLGRIVREHQVIAAMMDAMEREIAAFDKDGAFDLDLVRLILRYMAAYPDRFHHPKEELLFDTAAAKDPAFAERVAGIRADHDALPGLTARLDEVLATLEIGQSMPRDAVLAALGGYVARERDHMRRERDEVFPHLEAILTEAEWSAAEVRARAIDDPLLHPHEAGAFTRLRELILPLAA